VAHSFITKAFIRAAVRARKELAARTRITVFTIANRFMAVTNIIAVTRAACERAVIACETWITVAFFTFDVTKAFSRTLIGTNFHTAVFPFPSFSAFAFSFITRPIIAAFVSA